MSPLHGLGHLIMDQSYVCALIAMMVRSSPAPTPLPGGTAPSPPTLPGGVAPGATVVFS